MINHPSYRPSTTIDWFPGKEGAHFAGLPLTDGKWVEDRDRGGALLGWLEMFPGPDRRLFSVPGASRYIRVSDAYR